MKHELIGNKRKGRLEELMKKADNDPLISEVVEGKEQVQKKQKSGFGFLKLHPCDEAIKLIQGIEKKIGFINFKDGKLVKIYDSEDDYLGTFDSALLAIAYLGLGQKDKAEELVNSIEKHIGFHEYDYDDTKLIWHDNKTNHIMAFDNLALSIAYLELGRYADGYKLIETVIKRFDIDENHLIQEYVEGEIVTLPIDNILSALKGCYYKINDRLHILRKIENYFGFHEFENGLKLLKSEPSSEYVLATGDNALLATLYYHSAQKSKGDIILKSIKDKIHTQVSEAGTLIEYGYNLHSCDPRSSAALAIAYMAKEYCEKNET